MRFRTTSSNVLLVPPPTALDGLFVGALHLDDASNEGGGALAGYSYTVTEDPPAIQSIGLEYWSGVGGPAFWWRIRSGRFCSTARGPVECRYADAQAAAG